MPKILLATDANWIHEAIDAALTDDNTQVLCISRGQDVLPAVHEIMPDLVILDMQIGNMGGMASCMEIRLDQSVDRLGPVPIMMLLDREADVFLAERCDADGWVIKPLDGLRLSRAAKALLEGDAWIEGPVAAEVS